MNSTSAITDGSVVKFKRAGTSNKFAQYLSKFIHQKNPDPSANLVITNTRIGDKSKNIAGGSYHIPDEEYSEFLKIYREEVVSKSLPEFLTEKQIDMGPILIDIDLRYEYAVTERIHTIEHIQDFIFLYLDELKIMYQWTPDIHVPIFIFEKPNVNRLENKNTTKDGIHVIIGLQADHKTQMILRDRVLLKIANVWSNLPITNSWSDVFDEGISKGHINWQLYGSRKPNHDAYKLTHVYDIHIDPSDQEFLLPEISPSVYENDNDKFAMLSARYPKHAELFMTTKFAEEYASAENTGRIQAPMRVVGGGGGGGAFNISWSRLNLWTTN